MPTISLPNTEMDVTVTPSEQGPRVVLEREGLKLSFTIPPDSARLLIAALTDALKEG